MKKPTRLEVKLAKAFVEYARCHKLCDVVKLLQGPCTCGCAKLYEEALKIASSGRP